MKTSKLIGPSLDWAVAKIEKHEKYDSCGTVWVVNPDEPHFDMRFSPSTNWAQGGPIIERERIHTYFDPECVWISVPPTPTWVAWIDGGGMGRWAGDTLLVAAMRCFVANKLGESVNIPKELL